MSRVDNNIILKHSARHSYSRCQAYLLEM